jgi:hypothetical protein
VARGDLSDHEVSLDLAVDIAFGTMWYRLMSHHARMDAGLARQLTATLRKRLSPAADPR